MRIASVCGESLVNVQERIQDWSHIRLEEKRDEVIRWFRLLREKLVVIDLGLTMHMAGLWADSGLDIVVRETQALSYEELGQLSSTVGIKADQVVTRQLLEGEYGTLLGEVSAFADKSPAILRASLLEEAAVVKVVLVRHREMRSAMADIAEHLGVIACGFVPNSAAQAVEEYMTRSSKDASVQSFLVRCLAVIRAVAKLKGSCSFDLDHLGGWTHVKLCSGDQSTARGGDGDSIPFVEELRSNLLGWSVFSCIERLLQEALATVLAQFVKGLHLEAMRVPSGPTADQLLDTGALQVFTECAIRTLGDGASPTRLPSTCLHDIFWKLYDWFVENGHWQFNADDLYVVGDSPLEVHKETLRTILLVFRSSGDIVVALSILRWFVERRGSAFKGDTLRPEVFIAFDMADSAVTKLRVQLPDFSSSVATDGVQLPWGVPALGLEAWVGNAQVVVTDLKKDFIKMLGDRMEQEAQALAKATPATEHYIGDSLYIKALAKKCLIE